MQKNILLKKSQKIGRNNEVDNFNMKIIKHGHCIKYTTTYEYRVWNNMKSRTSLNCRQCIAKKNNIYYKLAVSGKAIDKSWEIFENFISDMGNSPSNQHQLDRIDNTKGYYKWNCRWVTRKEQMSNTSKNRYINYLGQTLTISEWARRQKIARETIRMRLNHGLPVEMILSRDKIPKKIYKAAKK